MRHIFHGLVLNLHQPPGNLDHLLEYQEWEAKEILWAYDRIPREAWKYEDLARIHLTLSGTLLETLTAPGFQERVYGVTDVGALLWHFQNARVFNVLGMGYYHPVLPLIPAKDRELHLKRWIETARHVLWRDTFQGFWPPEMGFSMELIPLIKRMGYQYVLVDSLHVEPVDDMSWQEVRYRPHIARHGGEEIVVVVRDRELSDAQEAGMEFGWFKHECHERTKFCDFPPLIVTATDGENGGWFRNTNPKGNFWGVFYEEFMNEIRNDWTQVRPIHIHDYLSQFGAHGEVKVAEGAWNTGWHHGKGFLQWTGSQAQKDAIGRVHEVSERLHTTRRNALASHAGDRELQEILDEAQWLLLRAETSCNFYWGEDWVGKCHHDLDAAYYHLERAWAKMR